MMVLLGFVVFSAAFGVAVWTIAATVMPRLDRIADALAGRPVGDFQPLSGLVLAERRIAVRRWATSAAPRQPVRVRAAA